MFQSALLIRLSWRKSMLSLSRLQRAEIVLSLTLSSILLTAGLE
jgi:hypothetical protein